MLWMTKPRTVGLLTALPAVPAMIALVHWTLAPAAAPPPPLPPAPSVDAEHHAVRTFLEQRVADRRRYSAWAEDAAPGEPSAGVPAGGFEPRRIVVHVDGREAGWVTVDPRRLAEAALARLAILRVEAELADEAERTKRTRFAEAARLAERRASARSVGGSSVDRERDDRLRLRRNVTRPRSEPAFRRPEFVEAVARERQQLRRLDRP